MSPVLWVALVGACGGEPPPSTPPPATALPEAPPSPEPPAERPERIAARHILVTWTGSEGAPIGTLRTRAEARRRIEDARARILAGEAFEALAQSLSDDPSRARGGFLGSGEAGTWAPAFEAAAFALAVGQVSEVVETDFGFHLIRRDPLEEVRLRHLVVQFEGALISDREAPSAGRTPAEARALAEQAHAALEAGEDFVALAARTSDGPMALRGADLGWFLRGELGERFDVAAFALEVGEHSGVVETPYGFHVIQRVE